MKGRPATGQDPVSSIRLSAKLRGALDAYVIRHPEPRPSRSEVIRKILEERLVHRGVGRADQVTSVFMEPSSVEDDIADLVPRVRAAQEEIATAIEFHETWKPMAVDEALHGRLGRSIASNTFLIIRTALRREMVSALLRLWGKANDPRNLGLKAIATTLRRRDVVDYLAARREALESVYEGDFKDMSPDGQEAVIRALRDIDRKEGLRQARMLRDSISEMLDLIGCYEQGGSRRNVLLRLLELRHHRLAHRQIESTAVEPENLKQIDNDIEPFYKDMLRIVSLLLLIVENHNYDPEAVTAARAAYNARVFWAGVRGERDEGHPLFNSLPPLPIRSDDS